jgi:putative intracellular protease/amidase
MKILQRLSLFASTALCIAALGLMGCATPAGTPPAASAPERLAPYQPRPGRSQPVVAVIGHNAGTELIDYVVPFGILSRSNAAQVLALGLEPGPVRMRPALSLQPEATVAQFDQRFPDGADYVIVPAVDMHKIDDPALLGWLRSQAGKGATLVSICDGALVVAKAGLFKGRRATGHWATRELREREFSDTHWQRNTRYVADGRRISSAGVTAAVPLSLALVEAIAGRPRAEALALELGVQDWDSAHDSERFRLGLGALATAAFNTMFTSRDEFELQLAPGADEVALALAADAWARTYRSADFASASSTGPVRTRSGLLLLPDAQVQPGRKPLPWQAAAAAKALDDSLAAIEQAYGRGTADLVRLQLEYPH